MSAKKHVVLTEAPGDSFDMNALKYPRDRFELVSVDSIEHYDMPYMNGSRTYHRMREAVHVTLRCKRCGTVMSHTDSAHIGCKSGSCHKSWKDLTGMVFGGLTALRYVRMPFSKGRKAGWYWECRCECGEIVYRSAHGLLNGNVSHCNRCAIRITRSKVRQPDNKAAWNAVLSIYRRNAGKRGISFSLTEEDIRSMCKEPCHYCGAAPEIPLRSGRDRRQVGVRNGIDRVDSGAGYSTENCVPCCRDCNRMKADMPRESWLAHISRILDHCKGRSTTIPEGSTAKRLEKDPVHRNGAQDIV